jgi:hypothetical protein
LEGFHQVGLAMEIDPKGLEQDKQPAACLNQDFEDFRMKTG